MSKLNLSEEIINITTRYTLSNGHVVEIKDRADKNYLGEVMNGVRYTLMNEAFIEEKDTLIRCENVVSVEILPEERFAFPN